MVLHLVKPEVEQITNREVWREILELLVDRAVPKDRREALAGLLDEHFVICRRIRQ